MWSHNMSTPSAEMAEEEATQELSSLSSLEQDLHPEILRHIFTFVGGYEYRFMCNISKSIRQRYVEQFPEKVTGDACAGMSVYHAQVYYDEREFIPGWKQRSDEEKKIAKIAEEAILQGNLDVLKWLLSWKDILHWQMRDIDKFAAKHGRIDCLRYLCQDEPPHHEAVDAAAASGQIETLIFLHNMYDEFPFVGGDSFACLHAAEGGHIDCLRYLHEQGHPLHPLIADAYLKAAKGDHLDCVSYLYENGCMPEETADFTVIDLMKAASEHSFRCFQYLHQRDCPWEDIDCLKAAAKGGNIESFQYIEGILHPNFAEPRLFHEEVSAEAAQSGRLEMLQYVHGKGCAWNMQASRNACAAGSIECLRYLHENGCPLDRECSKEAARAGSIECLQYLKEIGCEWDEEECPKEAGEMGRLCCIKYLHDNGCALSPSIYRAIMWRIFYRNRKSFELDHFLRDVPWGKTADYLLCLQYLKDSGVETTPEAIDFAIEHKMKTMFQYFNIDSMLKSDPHFCKLAAKHGALDILKYLHSQGFAWNKDSYLHCIEDFPLVISKREIYSLTQTLAKEYYTDELERFRRRADCLVYMKERGLELGPEAFLYVIRKGSLFQNEIIYRNEWKIELQIDVLYKEEWKSDLIFCSEAVKNGQVSSLKYLLQNGFEAAEDICVDAASSGHIECLQYLHINGFKLTEDALSAASNEECMKYCAGNLNPSSKGRKRTATEAL